MYHSTSFCAAGSAILSRVVVASSVLALRARSIASLTSARSPVSAGFASLAGLSFDRFDSDFDLDFDLSSACFAGRRFSTAALRWGRASLAFGVLASAVLCASWVFPAGGCLALVRAAAAVDSRASAVAARKQDSERMQG